jgi:hypothetical protein
MEWKHSHLLYFVDVTAIWYFYSRLVYFSIVVSSTNENLATLVKSTKFPFFSSSELAKKISTGFCTSGESLDTT